MPVNNFTYPPKMFNGTKRLVDQILWTIHLDGPFDDETGRASALLLEALDRRGITVAGPNLNALMQRLEKDGDVGDLVERKIAGKRTKHISLKVDPNTVPFPPNPWTALPRPRFQGRSDIKPKRTAPVERDDPSDLEETFTRQMLVEAPTAANGTEPEPEEVVAREVVRIQNFIAGGTMDRPKRAPEPEPEVEPELAAEPEPVPAETPERPGLPVVPSALPPEATSAVRTLPVVTAASSGELLTQAIGLITAAMTRQIEEEAARQEAETFDVDRRVDERMAAYVALIERNERLEHGYRRSLERERELVELVRTLQASVAANERRTAR